MGSMIVCMLPSVEYLHYLIWSCLRPQYVGSLTSLPYLRVEVEANRSDELWFVVFGFMLWVWDIVGYGLWVVRIVCFVVM